MRRGPTAAGRSRNDGRATEGHGAAEVRLHGRHRRTPPLVWLWRRPRWAGGRGGGVRVLAKVWPLWRVVGGGCGGGIRAGAAILGGPTQAVARGSCSLAVVCGAAAAAGWRM